MPTRRGGSWLESSSLTPALMARVAPAASAMTARSWERSRFAAGVRCALQCCRRGLCTSKVSPFAPLCAECRSIPASIWSRPTPRASVARYPVLALPIATSRVATSDPISRARHGDVSRCRSDRQPHRRLRLSDPALALDAVRAGAMRAAAIRELSLKSDRRFPFNDCSPLSEFAGAKLEKRAHPSRVAQVGMCEQPQLALHLWKR